MAKFRKKPVVIEAVQYGPHSMPTVELVEFLEGVHCSIGSEGLVIETLEGNMLASVGDWIIKGVNGEFYPCKPDVFEKTYEAAESPQDTDSTETVEGNQKMSSEQLEEFEREVNEASLAYEAAQNEPVQDSFPNAAGGTTTRTVTSDGEATIEATDATGASVTMTSGKPMADLSGAELNTAASQTMDYYPPNGGGQANPDFVDGVDVRNWPNRSTD